MSCWHIKNPQINNLKRHLEKSIYLLMTKEFLQPPRTGNEPNWMPLHDQVVMLRERKEYKPEPECKQLYLL